MEEFPTDFSYLKGYKIISLTTFYRSGRGVATPVDYALLNNKLFVNTPAQSYKVKRLLNTSDTLIAPCSMRGKILGPELMVQGRVLEDHENEEAEEAFIPNYRRFSWRMMRFFRRVTFWRTPKKRVYLEITLPPKTS